MSTEDRHPTPKVIRVLQFVLIGSENITLFRSYNNNNNNNNNNHPHGRRRRDRYHEKNKHEKWQGKFLKQRWDDENLDNDCFQWMTEWKTASTHTITGLQESYQ